MSHITDWFDYEEILEYRAKGFSWPQLGKIYNRVHTTVMRRFKKEQAKRKLNRQAKTITKPKKKRKLK